MTGIKPEHMVIIKRILQEFLPGVEVRGFGSRIHGVFQSWSDLDLAIVGKSRLEPRAMTQLQAVFEESDLPYRVDLLDWHNISPEFRELIQAHCEIIQPGTK
ncbi:MAG: nucleotidyltransferase domain-containing protein [Elusimicrobia bacterium]|nr:nucleotidyltransferase domain-containing protein [Elusimicrobiota bacterium]